MHNCSEIKEQLTELALDGVDCRTNEVLSAELNRCAACREEFDALSATLRATSRLRETAMPAQEYWTGYHARLRQKLAKVDLKSNEALQFNGPSSLVRFLKSSVPVPVPLGLALIVVCAMLVPFAIRAARRQPVKAPTTTIVHVPVPVIQEKIVTRIVYRDRWSRLKSSRPLTGVSNVENALARSQKPRNAEIPAALTGFKPTEEVKLTVIKGGSTNEK